ncbi:MAG: hypothetical protein KDA80_18870 [Planctomycetaceae bacterium]|nr:hypothetical protein [Planctomycetaceae bacterium]
MADVKMSLRVTLQGDHAFLRDILECREVTSRSDGGDILSSHRVVPDDRTKRVRVLFDATSSTNRANL